MKQGIALMNRGEAEKQPGAILYTRVSTGEQAEHGTSLASQREQCRAKAAALALPVVAEYEDAGISGAFLVSRPGMQAALADIAAGRADTLICANLSRYSRDVEHQQQIKRAVQEAGGRLVFCDMDFADTPEGDLAFGILGNFAAYERKVIQERTAKGRRRRAEEGIQPNRALSPFGYHVVTTADVLRGEYMPELLGRYVIVEPQAAVVRELFSRYAAGALALPGLCRDLNARRTPTPRGGTAWRPSTLTSLLKNPVYKGEALFGKTRIVTDEQRLSELHWRTGLPLKTTKTSPVRARRLAGCSRAGFRRRIGCGAGAPVHQPQGAGR